MRLAAVHLLALVLPLVLVSSTFPAHETTPASDRSLQRILDLGDSMSVGTAPYLATGLREYRIDRIYDVGLHAYEAAEIVARGRASLPPVLVVSAGTNDDPRIVSTFARAVAGVLTAAGRDRCVVWPTIARPPAVGAAYDGLNRALARNAVRNRNLVLVDWVGMVRRHRRWLADDGVHVSVAGYRARASAIAGKIRTTCARVVD